MLAERALERRGLVDVVLLRAGAVRVDVVDVLGVGAALAQRVRDRLGHLEPVGLEAGHVVRVAAAGEAGDLAVDVRAARAGVLELLEHQHRAALAHHEPVAVAVERPRGVAGLVVAREVALIGSKHAIEIGEMPDSEAPAITMSASPSWISWWP